MNVQRRRFLFRTKDTNPFDLVTASYVLSELKSDSERLSAAKTLWNNVAPGGILVLLPSSASSFSSSLLSPKVFH